MNRFLLAFVLILFSLSILLSSVWCLITVSAVSLIYALLSQLDLHRATRGGEDDWQPLTETGGKLRDKLLAKRWQLELRAEQLEAFRRERKEAERLSLETASPAINQASEGGPAIFDRVAETLTHRFGARKSGLIIQSLDGPQVFQSGEFSQRVEALLAHIFNLHLRNPCAATGLIDEAVAQREFGDFSEFGIGKFVIYRASGVDGKLAILWMGYSPESTPDHFALKSIREFVHRFSEGLLSLAKLQEFESKVLDLVDNAHKKNELLSHMSHDIRSPLANVRTTLELLQAENEDPENTVLIDSAILNCESLSEIVDELLIYFKHSAGRLKAASKQVNALDLIRSVINAYAVSAMKKGLRLELFSTVHDPMIKVDPLHFRRVLFNLVGNAIKYTNKGEVLVSIGEQKRGSIAIGVHDTGLGMNKNQLELLYTPFRRFHPAQAEGVGLGLALSKALVELNNGKIEVSSKEGKGSQFRITFPRSGEVGRSQVATSALTGCRKLRILLVDDEPALVDSLARALESEHLEVDRAYSVQDAKSISAFGRPDAVLLDYRMPGGGARDLLAFLRTFSVPRTAVLTGDEESAVKEDLKEYGVDYFFQKPVEVYEIEQWLRQVPSTIPEQTRSNKKLFVGHG